MADVRIYGTREELEEKGPELLAKTLEQLGPFLKKAKLPKDFEIPNMHVRALNDLAKMASKEYAETIKAMIDEIGEVLDNDHPIRKGMAADPAEIRIVSEALTDELLKGTSPSVSTSPYAFLNAPFTVPGKPDQVRAHFAVVPGAVVSEWRAYVGACPHGPVVLLQAPSLGQRSQVVEAIHKAILPHADTLLADPWEAPWAPVLKSMFRELNRPQVEDRLAKADGADFYEFIRCSDTYRTVNPGMGRYREPFLGLAMSLYRNLMRAEKSMGAGTRATLKKAAVAAGWEPEDLTDNLGASVLTSMIAALVSVSQA